MADIQKRATANGGTKWDVRYRDSLRRQRKRAFDRKVDAQRFANSVEADLVRGDWIDPDRGRELFGDWADKWLATTANRKPKTRGERRVDGYPEYGLFVRFAAFTGLRAGELVGLRMKDLHLVKRRVYVHQSASEAYGQLQIVATKTYERRSVPIPRSLIDELTVQVDGLGQDDYVWQSPEGGPFRYSNWMKRHFKPAVERAGVPAGTRFHDLRHTYAALLIAQSAHPRAIMERMGHSTITVTLDNYGHLFPKLDAALDEALDGVYRVTAIGLRD